jgi:hypothetical protein
MLPFSVSQHSFSLTTTASAARLIGRPPYTTDAHRPMPSYLPDHAFPDHAFPDHAFPDHAFPRHAFPGQRLPRPMPSQFSAFPVEYLSSSMAPHYNGFTFQGLPIPMPFQFNVFPIHWLLSPRSPQLKYPYPWESKHTRQWNPSHVITRIVKASDLLSRRSEVLVSVCPGSSDCREKI